MKIKTFIWTKIKNLFLLSILFSGLAFVINSLTDNLILELLSEGQQKQTLRDNPCNKQLNIKDGTLTLQNFIFDVGDGNCVEQLKANNVNKIIIDDVYGGDTTETRIMAKYVKENSIPILVKGACNSSCVDLFLHSPDRSVCVNDGKIGIHSYKNNTYEEDSAFMTWLRENMQDAMLRAHRDTNINTDFIKSLYSKTSNEDLYVLSFEELKEHNFAHRIVSCK